MHAEQKAKRISISPISRDSKRSPEAVKKPLCPVQSAL